jgi:hypothetical protein
MFSHLCINPFAITDRNAGYAGLKLGSAKFVFCYHLCELFGRIISAQTPECGNRRPLPARSRMRARASSSVTSATRQRRARFSPKSAPPAAVPKVCPQISWPRLAKQVREIVLQWLITMSGLCSSDRRFCGRLRIGSSSGCAPC